MITVMFLLALVIDLCFVPYMRGMVAGNATVAGGWALVGAVFLDDGFAAAAVASLVIAAFFARQSAAAIAAKRVKKGARP